MILAVVDYLDHKGEPPPELQFYIHTRDHGDPWGRGWMNWPSERISEMTFVGNIYNAWRSYTAAEDRVAWLKAHQGGAEIIGEIKSVLYETEPGLTRMERWERLAGDVLARQQWERLTGR